VSSLARSEVRLAELVASMSLATHLGLGQPLEHVSRSCVLGLRIGEDLKLGEDQRAVVYYVALLAWLGCHADAHEQSAWFGDDSQLRADRHHRVRRRALGPQPRRTRPAARTAAASVAFLASDDPVYITGAELVVDGGYLAR
jgi:hypothetical protein